MNKFKSLFGHVQCPIIGMVHLKALPGTPRYKNDFEQVVAKAIDEARLYQKHDLDGIMIENMHDIPYVQADKLGPETVACMSRIATEIRKLVPKLPMGIQILACGNKEAVSIAKACRLQFVRVEGFVFGHVADEGYTNACAGELLRYRNQIDANEILILTDVKKKHSSHAITADLGIVETSKAAEFFLSDGIILTGQSTGDAVNLKELQDVSKCTALPKLIGSGVTIKNVSSYFGKSNGLIIGSHFKESGKWDDENLSESRIHEFMRRVKDLRSREVV